MAKEKLTATQLKEKLAAFLEKFAAETAAPTSGDSKALADGTYDISDQQKGGAVLSIDADGKKTPIADGKYSIKDGSFIFTVKDGVIDAIFDPATGEKMADQPTAEAPTEPVTRDEFNALVDTVNSIVDKVNSLIDPGNGNTFKSQFASATSLNEMKDKYENIISLFSEFTKLPAEESKVDKRSAQAEIAAGKRAEFAAAVAEANKSK